MREMRCEWKRMRESDARGECWLKEKERLKEKKHKRVTATSASERESMNEFT